MYVPVGYFGIVYHLSFMYVRLYISRTLVEICIYIMYFYIDNLFDE